MAAGGRRQQPPRPEHPTPSFRRVGWLNLNGPQWEYALRNSREPEPAPPEEWDGHITVPFCLQSPLSGTDTSLPKERLAKLRPPLARGLMPKEVLWYRLHLETLPEGWLVEGRRVLLHVGACDYTARVIINGVRFPEHVGGSTPFSHDITDALLEPVADNGGGLGVLLLCCRDSPPNRKELLPCGKQCRKYFGGKGPHLATVYSNVSGIWQTVWLESVPSLRLAQVQVVPQMPVRSGGPWVVALVPTCCSAKRCSLKGHVVFEATLFDTLRGEKELVKGRLGLEAPVAGTTGKRRGSKGRLELSVPVGAARPWGPTDPHLHRLRYRLISRCGGKVLDEVNSYVGLRVVQCRGDQVLLNGEPIYLNMVLDQGYFPDGLWTAPSAEAFRLDIRLAKALGFNGARAHQKVFEPWYFFHADRLGFLVSAEYPDWAGEKTRRWTLPPEYKEAILNEWPRTVQHLHNHPSIIMWTMLNEIGPAGGWRLNRGPGGGFSNWRTPAERTRAIKDHEEFVKTLLARMRRRDAQKRPVNDASGYIHVPMAKPDLWSFHEYTQDPKRLRGILEKLPPRHVEGWQGQPLLVDEYGGVGLEVGGPFGVNPPKFNPGYGGSLVADGQLALERIGALTEELRAASQVRGFCYTQLYDIEYEKNGLLKYNRTPKPGMAVSALRQIFGGGRQASQSKRHREEEMATTPQPKKRVKVEASR